MRLSHYDREIIHTAAQRIQVLRADERRRVLLGLPASERGPFVRSATLADREQWARLLDEIEAR